jgi:hypothetical protein
MFNERKVWERAQTGELRERLHTEGHPSPRRSGEPACTRSQIIGYYDQRGRQVAIAHQYLRPNDSIGGSGRPDPKRLYADGVLYRC